MSRDEALGIVGIAVVLLVASFFWFSGESTEKGGEEMCVKVKTSCCPCNMGGTEKCVLASEVEKHEENLSECSPTTLCSAVFNCEIESCKYVDEGCVAA